MAIKPSSGSGDAQPLEQPPHVADGAAALLLLLADIDLDVEREQRPAFSASLSRASSRERPIERMDRVEQFTASAALLDWSRPTPAAECRDGARELPAISLRLLDAVLAEVALSRIDQRFYVLGRAALADRDQLDVGRIAARDGRSRAMRSRIAGVIRRRWSRHAL